MRTLTEQYTNYLNFKDDGILVSEFLSYEEYQILYEDWESIKKKVQRYRDLETIPKKIGKYSAAGAIGATAGGVAGSPLGVGGTAIGAYGGMLLATIILASYRRWTDACYQRCKRLISYSTTGGQTDNNYYGPEYSLCRAKCNKQGAIQAIDELKTKTSAALKKVGNDKEKQEKIKKKAAKMEVFFNNKLSKFNQEIKDYEGSMRGRSGQGH
jgi:hypothetical protein